MTTRNNSRNEIIVIECQILRALCSVTIIPADWTRLAEQLTGHVWQEPDHKVIYDALRSIKSREPSIRRNHLAGEVTRMGFPDVDWQIYFDSDKARTLGLEELTTRLRDAITARH